MVFSFSTPGGELVVTGGETVVEGAVEPGVEVGAPVTIQEQAELTERILRLQPPKHAGMTLPSV